MCVCFFVHSKLLFSLTRKNIIFVLFKTHWVLLNLGRVFSLTQENVFFFSNQNFLWQLLVTWKFSTSWIFKMYWSSEAFSRFCFFCWNTLKIAFLKRQISWDFFKKFSIFKTSKIFFYVIVLPINCLGVSIKEVYLTSQNNFRK